MFAFCVGSEKDVPRTSVVGLVASLMNEQRAGLVVDRPLLCLNLNTP